MWPGKEGLGAQITYGTNGPNLYLSQYGDEKPWHFPRGRNQGHDFHIVKNSFVKVQNPSNAQLPLDQKNRDNKNSIFLSDVPPAVLHGIEEENENEFKNSELIYDPSVGDIVQCTKIKRTNGKMCDILTCSGGAVGDTLIVRLVERKTGVLTYDERIKEDNENSNSKNNSYQGIDRESTPKQKDYQRKIHIPHIIPYGCEMKLDSVIRQVETFRNSTKAIYQLQFQHILVRTVKSLYLIHVVVSADLSIRLKVFNQFECENFHGFEFSHVTVDPYQLNRCAVIDSKGNWHVLKISKDHKNFVKLQKGVMLDFGDLSKFKRIKWLDNADELLLISRIAVKKVNLQTEEVTELISGNRWSFFRDYTALGTDDNYGLLLTSRELILIDIKAGFKRSLSWLHFLNAIDPSLRFVTKSIKDVTYIMLFSIMDPLVFIYQLKFINNLPVMLHDPVMIRTSGDVDSLSFHMALNLKVLSKNNQSMDEEDQPSFEDDDDENGDGGDYEDDEEDKLEETSITLFKQTTDLQLTQEILSHKPCFLKIVDKFRNSFGSGTKIDGDDPFYNLFSRKDVYGLRNAASFKRIARAFSYLPKITTEQETSQSQAESLAQYTQNLSISTDEMPFHLLERATPINVFDFDEYSEIMDQLAQHCEEIGLDFYSFSKYLSLLFPATDFKKAGDVDISILFQTIKSIYSNNENIDRAILTRDLILVLHGVLDPSRERKELVSTANSLKSVKLQSILTDWDNDYEEYDLGESKYDSIKPKFQRHSKSSSQAADHFSQPVIRLTQSQNQSTGSSLPTQISKTNFFQRSLSSQGLIKPRKRDFQSSQASMDQSQSQLLPGTVSTSGSYSSQAGLGFGSSQNTSGKKKKKRKSGFA